MGESLGCKHGQRFVRATSGGLPRHGFNLAVRSEDNPFNLALVARVREKSSVDFAEGLSFSEKELKQVHASVPTTVQNA